MQSRRVALWGFSLIVLSATLPVTARARGTLPTQAGSHPLAQQTGIATFYGGRRRGHRMADGHPFHDQDLVAAHPTYPFGTILKVTNLKNAATTQVRVTDRGPSAARRRHGVIIDLSRAAASKLGFIRAGRARVRVEVLAWGGDPSARRRPRG